MRKLQKSFLKKTLEVYYSQSINKISTEQLIKTPQKIERSVIVKTGNGRTHNLRFKHFSTKEPPYEWIFYRQNSNKNINFLPAFILGSKLKNGKFIYFLQDYSNKEILESPVRIFDNFCELLKSFKTELNDFKYNKDYFDNFKIYLKDNGYSNIINYYNEYFNSKKHMEISCLFNKNNLAYSENALKIMDLNELNYHIPGFSYWSLYKDKDNISINDYLNSFLDKTNWDFSMLKKLSYLEYNFNIEYEKKEY